MPWSKVAGDRPRPALRAPRPAAVPERAGSPLLLFASIGLAAAIVIGVVLAAETIGGGDDGGIVGGVTETPGVTLIPPASETPAPSGSPSPTASGTPTASPAASTSTGTTTPTPGRSPTRTPVVGSAAASTPAPFPTPNSPQGGIAAALWANTANYWWYGGLTQAMAQYQEGQEVPLLVQWDGAAGQTYWLRITYDCAAQGALGAIDYLSGVESWGRGIVYAAHGPAADQPDAAVTVPDTSGFSPDDGNPGLFTLYGAKFPVLPQAPAPSGACPGQRTVSLPVQASGGKITLLASGHLGAASVYGPGKGAAGATAAMSLIATVDGIGAAVVSIGPSAVSDAAH